MSEYSLPNGKQYVPIRFMDRHGNVSNKPPGSPVAKVALMYDPDYGKGQRLISNFHTVYALIDTGADDNYSTPGLIQLAGCPKIGATNVHGATSSIESTKHFGHIFFPETGKQFETDIFSAPLDQNHREYPLIIGMLIIKHCRLVMDFKKDIYRLYMD